MKTKQPNQSKLKKQPKSPSPSEPKPPKPPKVKIPKPEPGTVMYRRKHEFADKEIADFGRGIGRLMRDREDLEAQLTAIKNEFKVKLETVDNEISHLNNKIQDGFEMRDVEAMVVMFPAERIKRFYVPNEKRRLQELLGQEAMTEGDRQMILLNEPKPKPPAPAKAPEVKGKATTDNIVQLPAGTPPFTRKTNHPTGVSLGQGILTDAEAKALEDDALKVTEQADARVCKECGKTPCTCNESDQGD